jgi:hypothetical protein
VRRSIQLKVKGLTGSTSKHHSLPNIGSPLMASFSFSRFTPAEIVDLFYYFRVQLGHNDLQREQIITSFRIMQRKQFDSLVH